MANASGVVQERYTYSSFGKLHVFDALFVLKSASTYNLTRTFTGQVLDNETGLMLYRNRVYHPTLGRFLQRDPIGYMAGDVNLVRYVRNQTLVNVDFEGWQGQGWSISPIGTLELPPYMPLLPKPEPLTKPKPSILPKPDQTIRGNVPDTITGFPYGWNHLWTPSQRDEMNRECCNMAPNPPTFASTGPGTGEYIIYGLPTDRPQIGTGGANPCVAVIIKCDDVVYVYHYDAPSKPASYPEIKNKRIVLRLSAAVLRTTTLMVNPQGV